MRLSVAAAVLGAAMCLPALATPQPAPVVEAAFAGQWQCEMAGKAHNNDPIQAHSWSFALVLSANGQWEAQGTYYSPSVGQQEQLVAQGTWGVTRPPAQQAFMVIDGTWTRYSPTGLVAPFSAKYPVALNIQNERAMSMSVRDQFTETHAACRR